MAATTPRKIGVIGSGPAGLAAARVLTRDLPNVQVTVLEQRPALGGVWKYEQHNQNHPMYRGLRTNLPKEIMAYREYPWDNEEPSFVTHETVLNYLQSYARHFGLQQYVTFGATVEQLTVLPGTKSAFQPSNNNEDVWPEIRLDWTISQPESSSTTTTKHSQVFDAVCICNGHYSAPSIPHIPGLQEYFEGQTMHSIAYDDPRDFQGQTVLCIGGRASGSDVARELVTYGGAKHVYLSDTTCTKAQMQFNVTWVPKTIQVLPDGRIQFDQDCSVQPVVDTIIFCTGYDYTFPFIHSNSNCPLEACQRRVQPLYQQLWHAQYPNLCFVGLPHTVLPFPLFELQMEAFAYQLQHWNLANLPERLEAAKRDAHSGGAQVNGRVPQDTHYLGSAQWDYCQRFAQYAGRLDDSMKKYLATNKAIYDCAAKERKSVLPGAPDEYRETIYHRNQDDQSFQVVRSIVNENLEDSEQLNGIESQ